MVSSNTVTTLTQPKYIGSTRLTKTLAKKKKLKGCS